MTHPARKSSSVFNWIVALLCIGLAFGWSWYSGKKWPAPKTHAATPAVATAAVPLPATLSAVPDTAPAAPLPPEQLATLENEHIRVSLTSRGGGIARIEMKRHALEQGTAPIFLNAGPGNEEEPPIFALTGWPGQPAYAQQLRAADGVDHVIYTRLLPGGVRLERDYSLSGDYGITLVQTVTNPGAAAVTLPPYSLQIGAATKLYPNDNPAALAVCWQWSAGGKLQNILSGQFDASRGFLGFNARPARAEIASAPGQIHWAAVKNRFFTLLLTPPVDDPIQAVVGQPATPLGPQRAPGVRAAALFAEVPLAAGQTLAQSFSLYAGPKEHGRLDALGRGQQAAMDYGMFGWVAIPLGGALEWMHRFIPNYGWVIVLLTLALKIILWPLQSISNRSMKGMQALGPKTKELQEKYKEDPQRLQVEMMKLYKEYGVNPIGGCLPMLVQFPIFIGFYTMLQNAGQFQHQSWLWVHDLVQPDTIGYLPFFHLPINPLPIISACTQYVVMKLTPQASGASANPQMKILQWMPFLMLVILYQFAAALSLYWTVNNLVTMVQNYRNLKKPVPTLQRVKRKAAPKRGR